MLGKARIIEQEGFLPVFCQPERDPAPASRPLKEPLYARVQEADSLIQIIPLLDHEVTVYDTRARLAWLVREFHTAMLAAKPVVQLFQVIQGRASQEDWTAMFDPVTTRDQSFFMFKNVRDLLGVQLPRSLRAMSKKLEP